MAYLSQVGAQLHEARRLFTHAEQEKDHWPNCGHLLARALEHATCAAFIAWDEPHAAERKMHRFFDERLARAGRQMQRIDAGLPAKLHHFIEGPVPLERS